MSQVNYVETVQPDRNAQPPPGFTHMETKGTGNPHRTEIFAGAWNHRGRKMPKVVEKDRSGSMLGKFETGESMGI